MHSINMADNFVRINCPTCDRRLKIPQRSVEKAIVCPKCNTTFRVDEQSNTVVMEGRNDLFGPPVSDEYSNGDFDSNAFGDIDRIIDQVAQDAEDDGKPLFQGPKTVRQLEVQTASNARAAADETKREPEAGKTKFEKSLGNNGVGLLILAVGICLIPFAAGNVTGLRPTLIYLPVVAILIAFVGCFMLAYSRRRESLASLVLACMPLMFMGLLCFGSYYYSKNFLPEKKLSRMERIALEEAEAAMADEMNEVAAMEAGQAERVEKDEADRLTMDPNSINNNAASNFVPKRNPKPIAPTDVPANKITPPEPHSPAIESSINTSPESRDAADQLESADPLARELAAASNRNSKAEKLQKLRLRMQNDLLKGSASHSQIREPALLQQYKLTEVAGRSTVFGFAHYSELPIRGLDFGYRNDKDKLIDLVVPVVDEFQFKDSIVPPRGSRMVGVNVAVVGNGVVGLQGIFDQGAKQRLGDWMGSRPRGSKTIRLEAGGDIYGVIVYRDQLTAVGIQLIEKPRDSNLTQ